MLAGAFYDDPILGWLMPDESKRQARLRRFFAIELRHVSLPREASSERSAALYERLGFRLLCELRVGGSPPLRLMLRPPSCGRAMA